MSELLRTPRKRVSTKVTVSPYFSPSSVRTRTEPSGTDDASTVQAPCLADGKVVLSRYFTPSPERKRVNRHTSPIVASNGKGSTVSVVPPFCTPGSRLRVDECDDLEAMLAQLPPECQDPRFLPYFEHFMCLYRELSSAKPILIQETVADDPWKIIIATVLLNKTTGRAAIPVFRSLIALYPDPQALANASVDDLAALLQPLGLFNIRAKRLIDISKVYIADPPDPGRLRVSKNKLYIPVEKHISPSPLPYPPTPISHIPGTGPYALDSYRIFCGKDDEWMQVLPSDKELIRYLKWKWAYDKGMRWFAGAGACGDVDHDYLVELTTDLNNTIP